MINLPIAALSFDAIIGIIAVVVWLIVQGASKRGRPDVPSPPPPTPGAGEPVNPQDELRRFFEQLEKGLSGQEAPSEPQPAETPPPPPPLPAKRQSMTQADVHGKAASARRHSTPAAKPAPALQPAPVTLVPPIAPQPEFAWNLSFPETVSTITTLKISDADEQGATVRVPYGFHSRSTLRRMIVGSEVLGKPIALRYPSRSPA